jgi:GNAT superfamily N-acetyltransferase
VYTDKNRLISTVKQDNMTTNIDYHSVAVNEQQQAIHLWPRIFPMHSVDCFKRYYSSAAPSYRDGDTLAAWDNEDLISTVHVFRLTLRNGDDTYLCGGIANVTTLPEYRERGISRHLLQQAIDKMKNEGFHISILHTGRHSHYTCMGFEQCSLSRRIYIDLHRNINDASLSSKFDWKKADVDEEIINTYHKQPRPFQVDRPREYFQGWVNWYWQQIKAIIHVIPEEGYVVLNAETESDIYSIYEWRATNRKIEEKLLTRASYKAQQSGAKQIRLVAAPAFIDRQWIEKNLGTIVKIDENEKTMIRNINLTVDQFDKIKSLYRTGEATVWPGDYF